jgi:hypothetical protein
MQDHADHHKEMQSLRVSPKSISGTARPRFEQRHTPMAWQHTTASQLEMACQSRSMQKQELLLKHTETCRCIRSVDLPDVSVTGYLIVGEYGQWTHHMCPLLATVIEISSNVARQCSTRNKVSRTSFMLNGAHSSTEVSLLYCSGAEASMDLLPNTYLTKP